MVPTERGCSVKAVLKQKAHQVNDDDADGEADAEAEGEADAEAEDEAEGEAEGEADEDAAEEADAEADAESDAEANEEADVAVEQDVHEGQDNSEDVGQPRPMRGLPGGPSGRFRDSASASVSATDAMSRTTSMNTSLLTNDAPGPSPSVSATGDEEDQPFVEVEHLSQHDDEPLPKRRRIDEEVEGIVSSSVEEVLSLSFVPPADTTDDVAPVAEPGTFV